jgi:hypothetical protein
MIRTPDPALKTLTAALVKQAGGLEACAAATGLPRSTLAEYYAPGSPLHAPVDAVAELERCTQTVLVTAELARRAGYALVPLDAAPGAGSFGRCLAAFGREVAEVFAAHAEAMADGRLSAAEAERVERELLDVIRAAYQAVRALPGRAPAA